MSGEHATRAPLVRLHFLNALFSDVTGRDLYHAAQIDGAVRAVLGEAADDDGAYAEAVSRLRRALAGGGPGDHFVHVEAEAGLLWLRERVVAALRAAGQGPLTLVITGLAAARDRRARRAARERAEAVEHLREIAGAEAAAREVRLFIF
jgi:hypothetical protein